MGQSYRSLLYLVFAILGVWAIAQSNDPEKAEWIERVAQMKNDLIRLDENRKMALDLLAETETTLQDRDKEITRLEEILAEKNQEIERLKLVAQERDQLKQDLANTTVQRDEMNQRCDSLTKGLQALLENDTRLTRRSGAPAPATPVSGSRQTPGKVASREK